MRKVMALVCCGVSLAAMSAPGMAQVNQVPAGAKLPTTEPAGANLADNTGELSPTNDIIVQARRRDESVQDVPQTVNVVTAAQVEKLNLRNFTEIQNVVPGLQLQSNGAFSNQATVRGIAFAPEASGSNPSVEFYLNDAPISSAFLFQSTFDFGQFELQRGPQGTLRGRAAPSGSIAVTTRRPDLSEVGVVMNGTYSDLHARKLDGAFNIPIIRDVLAVRVAGVIDNNRANRVRSISEAVNTEISEQPYNRTKGIRGSVRFEPTDWARFNFMYQNLHSERHTYDQLISESLINPAVTTQTQPIIGAYPRIGNGEQGAYNRQDQDVFIANADITFAQQRLSYVGAYNKQENGILAAQDPGNFFAPPRVSIVPRTSAPIAGYDPVCSNEAVGQGAILSTGAYNQCTHQIGKRESHELRLASEERIGGIFDYVVGGFYDHNSNPTNLVTETPIVSSLAAIANPALPVTVLTNNRSGILRRGKSTEKSVFGNLTAHLFDDRLELSGGLRYIDYKSDDLPTFSTPASAAQIATGRTVACPDFSTLTCFPLGVGAGVVKSHKTIYTASVKYKISRDVMVYALTGSSFRPGPRVVGDFSAAQTAREQSFLNLPNETSKSYEIGAKTSFLDGRGRFNISAFHQSFKNYPFRGPSVFYVSTSAVTGVQEVANFNFVSPVPVKVNGVEGEASYQILEHWSLGVNAAYSDGKIKNGTIACTDLNRDGTPDTNPATPTLAQLQAAVGAGQTIAQCTGLNQRSAQSPKFSANVQSELGFGIGGNSDGFVRGLYSFFGKTINDPRNGLDNVGNYGLLNLYAGIRDKDGAWEISLFGKNITREREILSVSNAPATTSVRSATASGQFVSSYRTISVTTPREFGVAARVALGSR